MDLVLDVLSWIFLLVGSFVAITGAIGLLRLPDFYTRIHAASMTDTLGAWMIVIGLMFQATDWLVAVKLALVIAFLGLTVPLSGHALAKAAWSRHLAPLLTEDLARPDHAGKGDAE
jgi:multicomponent Na+:H+ antiporter subunit G